MTAAGVIIRWVHLVPGLSLIGVFTALILAGPSDRPTARAWEARLARWTRGLALLVLVSGVGTAAFQAAQAAGRATAALEPATWLALLFETRFGAVWLFRHGLLLLLAALVFFRGREHTVADWAAFRLETWLLGAVAAGALAWAGHAAAVEPGALGASLADALHLVTAGLWLGALLPLALLLRSASGEVGADSRPFAVLAIRRFSRLALIALLVLVGTGVWNAWSEVGGIPALLGTHYGRLLLLKLFLLLPVLVLASVNRATLLPALSGDGLTVGRPAMAALARAVTLEWALGMGIVLLASAMATTPPARHAAPSWPLSFRLDYGATLSVPGARARLLIGSQLALVGLLAALAGWLPGRRRALLVGAGGAALVAGLAVALPPLAVDAYPTTYRRPAVAYTALSVANGMRLYAGHCASCHGTAGHGDGPRGAGLPRPPADLAAPRTISYTAGDLFWRLTQGSVTAGMPAFGGRLSEDERWDLINFLRALTTADAARQLGPAVSPPDRPRLVAPDFAYAVGPTPIRSLAEFRGRRAVLLVLFTLPGSRERLADLTRNYDEMQSLEAEVLAVPMDADPRVISPLGNAPPPILYPVVTEGSAEITRAYGLFCPVSGGGLARPPCPHAEFLIDRQGYLRARWIPGAGGPGWSALPALTAQLLRLEREAPAAPADQHVH